MPKDWTISFIEEVGPSRLMMTPLISNVILKVSVGKNRVAIVTHLVIVRTVTLWTMCSGVGIIIYFIIVFIAIIRGGGGGRGGDSSDGGWWFSDSCDSGSILVRLRSDSS